jgi:hypothetical protein
MERLQRREPVDSQLVEPPRTREILEAVLAKVGQRARVVEQVARALTEHDLSSVPDRHDSRRRVHVQTDVLGRVESRLPGVDPHADGDRATVERRHGLPDRANGAGRSRERVEEGVALVIDLVAAVATKRLRMTSRCAANASRYPSWPRSSRTRVDPSISVKTSVTVPDG